jgi:cell wall-associated NlpC family hydrolase
LSLHVRMSAGRLLAHLTALLLALMTAGTAIAPAAVAGSAPETVRAFGVRATTVAAKYEGTPYRWGGTTPRGFDCSGYTQYVYAKLGIEIPRTSQAQFNEARKVGKRVRAGDLVFFFRTNSRSVYHVGIYAGDARIWHAPEPGTKVQLAKIWTTRWAGGRY